MAMLPRDSVSVRPKEVRVLASGPSSIDADGACEAIVCGVTEPVGRLPGSSVM